MLKIQVLGTGLIPRGYGLAPRVEPFPADLTLIQTIMATPGLSVNMIHPDDGHIVAVTNANLKRLWEKYSGKVCTATPAAKAVSTPPESKQPVVTPPVKNEEETPVKETTPAAEVKVEKPVEEKPVVEEVKNEVKNNNQNNNNHQNNQQKNNNNNNNGNVIKPINSDDKKK